MISYLGEPVEAKLTCKRSVMWPPTANFPILPGISIITPLFDI